MPQIALSVLDVGHGNSAVLVDNTTVIVVDAGPGTSLLEFLDREDIKKIDVLLISHADADHIKGIISLLESEMPIDLVQLNTDSKKSSDLWNDLTYELDEANRKGKLQFEIGLTTTDSGKFDTSQVHIEIVAPTPGLAVKGPGSTDHLGRRLTSNSNSAVIRLSIGGTFLALLPGDIDKTGFKNLLESGKDPSAPIAVFPHHGGKSGKADESEAFARIFSEAVKPDTIIFSNGRGSHGTPRKEIILGIRDVLPNARIACTQLSENCAPDLNIKDFRHLVDKFAKGKETGKCCAGTIVIDLGEAPPDISPDEASHKAFITKAASTPQCLSD